MMTPVGCLDPSSYMRLIHEICVISNASIRNGPLLNFCPTKAKVIVRMNTSVEQQGGINKSSNIHLAASVRIIASCQICEFQENRRLL